MDEEIRKDEVNESEDEQELLPAERTSAGAATGYSEGTGAGAARGYSEGTGAGVAQEDSENQAFMEPVLDNIEFSEHEGCSEKEKHDFGRGLMTGMMFVMVPVLIVLAATVCYLRSHDYYISIASKETINLSSKISAVKKVIDEYYLFDYDEETMDDSAVSSYVDGLGDPYSVYYDEDAYQELLESNSGSYKGIGVTITKDTSDGKIYITKVFADTPAEEAGIEPDDQLVKVNDTEVTGMELDDVTGMIKNSEDAVTLTIKRDGKVFKVDVTCQTVSAETVESKMLDDKIGYIQLTQFEEVSTEQFQSAVDSLKEQGMEKLLVDLRDNPGGMLNTAIDIADIFVDTGVVVTVKDKNDKVKEYKADEKGALGLPTVVLVNGDSASASEVLSGCLKDYDLATLVGTQTFGKGIVQNVIPFSDGTGIKITTAHYYTPDGNDIHGVGITPDVVVEDDPDTDQDEQLEKALEVIKEMN